MATRWRSPPDSSPGKRDAVRRWKPDLLEQRCELALGGGASMPRSMRAGRMIAVATRWRGLSDSYGFWKISCTAPALVA